MVNEFEGQKFECVEGLPCQFPDGEMVLNYYNLHDHNKFSDIGVLLTFLIVFVTCSYLALAYTNKEKR